MDIPYEILVYLFKYLSKSDRQAASETCHLWYVAANDSCFLRKKLVVFYKSILSDKDSPLEIFIKSPSSYCNYLFNEVEITSKTDEFWDRIGENILSLTIRNCDVGEKEFVYILEKCQNLEALCIESCKELFMSGRLLEGKTHLDNSLQKLRILSLYGNQYMTDALFNRFVKTAPLLEELNLTGCALQFHPGLVRKFYPPPNNINSLASESVFTFFFVLNFISTRAKSFKRLLFSNTLVDGVSLKSLCNIENLKLDRLDLHCCDQLTSAGLLSLASTQTNIKVLNIGMCSRVSDQSLVHICNNLIHLEYLNIQRCRAVTDLGMSELRKLTKLQSLNISQCELITKIGIEAGICYGINKTLNYLDIHSMNMDENTMIMIAERLPNLLFLDLSYCFNAVTDTSIQAIFKSLVYLNVLKISHCDRVSDAGLTGMGKVDGDDDEDDDDDELPIMVSLQDETLHPRIHLGSRAEEEILRDAIRKHEVMKMCAKLTMDNYSGYNLARLKLLRELDISGCNRITDVSLTYAFNFKELSTLNMSRCQQVTHEGIAHLVMNCPSIEYLNMAYCYNLKDDATELIVKGFQRLQQFDLKGCSQVSDQTLHAVKAHCTKLKVLDLQGCRNVTREVACSMTSPRTLHTVILMKPDACMTNGTKIPSLSTPFLPTFMRRLIARRTNAFD